MIVTWHSGEVGSVALLVGVLVLTVGSCSSSGPTPAADGHGGPGSTAAPTTPNSPTTATAVAARPSAGCGATAAVKPGQERVDLTSGGTGRWYLRHVPPSYAPPRPMPVVVDLHGYMVGATIETAATGLGAFGDTHGFLTITPQGSGPAKFVTWDTALGSGDVKFLGDLLDHVEQTLCVDQRRVFVTGYSQGAFMTSTLACVDARRIAAVAPVAGIRDPPGCRPARPVPVVAFHGTADPDIAYTGGLGAAALALPAPDGSGRTMGQEGLQHRPPLNGASIVKIAARGPGATDAGPVRARGPRGATSRSSIWPCTSGRTVELYRIAGGGHTWPGSPFTAAASAILGHTTMSISAERSSCGHSSRRIHSAILDRRQEQRMQVEDMIFISVDDHLVEPPHMFEGRLPGASSPTARPGSSTPTPATTCGSSTTRRSPTSGSTPSRAGPKRSTA